MAERPWSQSGNEAVLIARIKKRVYATFTVNDEKIKTKDPMKYLGVAIDARMSFKDHLRNAGLKASKVARALAGARKLRIANALSRM